ncbi:hypothetical protein DOTSEDRAFT_37056 [Dothistroma septosporum NZE10]|uniref:Uncharacterized protein n=1 Tax=Dothistroma septosporum (strain NZE10 / CBS 128990) TaxID=675120 RepID=N1PJL1_DOTSN|nr:hypothetical protein DOTSEDRAFT_37056 [Dothistroma septosporum NZE10]
MAPKTHSKKCKATPIKGPATALKAAKHSLSGHQPQLKDYTGDFTDTTFIQAKDYCKELKLPGGFAASHKKFVRRLQDHYDGHKATKGTVENASADQRADANGDEQASETGHSLEKPIKGGKKPKGINKASKVNKPPKSAKAAPTKTISVGGRGSRTVQPGAQQTEPDSSSRILSRGSHYRAFQLKNMLDTVRNLARSEGDSALDPFLDLLSEAYSAMNDIAPEPLSPDNPLSPLTPAGLS